jgi:hypothetical protein
MMATSATSSGQTSGRRGRSRQFRAPSDASFGRKKQGGEAELLGTSVELGEASNAGGRRRPWRPCRARVVGRRGTEEEGEQPENREEKVGRGGRGSLSPRQGGGNHLLGRLGVRSAATELLGVSTKKVTRKRAGPNWAARCYAAR